MGNEEDEKGKTAFSDGKSGPRVGRLVMRGKACEVKAAEPKESRSTRRVYPNQAVTGASGWGASVDRRFVPKAYGQEDRPAASGQGGHYDPQHMNSAMHGHYPMGAVPMGYYPHHHPAIHGAGGYMAPMYAPMAPMHPTHHGDGNAQHQALMAAHMDVNPADYFVQAAAHLNPYYHPHMVHQAHSAHTVAHPTVQHQQLYNTANNFPSPGPTTSVMQPAAPGLPAKEESS